MAKRKNYYKDKKEFVEIMSSLFDEMKRHPKVGPAIKKAKIIVKFVYKNPDASVLVNAADDTGDPDVYFDFEWEADAPKPDVTMISSADFSHRFWHGKENPFVGVALGRIKIKGNTAKALALLPVFEPAYRQYPKFLRKIGRGDIALGKKSDR